MKKKAITFGDIMLRLATPGVSPTEENLKEWFDAGVFCVGIGSKLFPKEILTSENYSFITQKCEETLNFISKYKR